MLKKKINLLWTGGWDSTFRLCQLSRMHNVKVQPIYIIHPHRKSAIYECKAQEKILKTLQKKKETKAFILPVKYINVENIIIPANISEAFARLRQQYPIGGQYEFLAAYAANCPGLELGEEHYYSRPGNLYTIFNAAGGLKFDKNNNGYLEDDGQHPDIYTIFGNFRYPIAHLKETEMEAIIKKWHYEDVMQHIWICATPDNKGNSCGVCVPCQIKMRAAMGHLLSAEARNNYKIYDYIKNKYGSNLAQDYVSYINTRFKLPLAFFDAIERKGRLSNSIKRNRDMLVDKINFFENLKEEFV